MSTSLEKQFDLLVRGLHEEIRDVLGVEQSAMMAAVYTKLRETTNLEQDKLRAVMKTTAERVMKKIADKTPQNAAGAIDGVDLDKLSILAIRNVLCTLWRRAIESHNEYRLDFEKLLPEG